jgi:hypothetical protein
MPNAAATACRKTPICPPRALRTPAARSSSSDRLITNSPFGPGTMISTKEISASEARWPAGTIGSRGPGRRMPPEPARGAACLCQKRSYPLAPKRYVAAMAGQGTQPVEAVPPPAALLRITNPIFRTLLSTPFSGAMLKQYMVLRFTGRKTGRSYAIPVVAHRLDGELYALTGAPWRHNFRDGRDVEVLLNGRAAPMRGQLIADPDAVAPVYARAIDHFGVKRSRRMLSLKINTAGTPSTQSLAEAAGRHHLAAIRLTERGG